MTAANRLKAALKVLSAPTIDLLKETVEPRLVRRAILGQQINAGDHLKLCAAIGLDPLQGKFRADAPLGDLHWASLSAALRMKRFSLNPNLTLRLAAREARTSYSALGRIERGEPVSIDAVIAVCRWLDRHPFDFVSPDVSREAETRSAA